MAMALRHAAISAAQGSRNLFQRHCSSTLDHVLAASPAVARILVRILVRW